MSEQEVIALYRLSDKQCPICRRIISKYEKSLVMAQADVDHLTNCILSHS